MISYQIYSSPEEIGDQLGQLLSKQLTTKPDSVLGLATGSTPLVVYKNWVERYRNGEFSFQKVTTFNLDEYVGLEPDHQQSYRYYMNENLFNHIDIELSNTHVPNGKAANLQQECLSYDRKIEENGKIDFQIVGIGNNGHIGFNEPDDSLQANTHVVQLAEDTRVANSRLFDSLDEVPTQAITVGMGPILQSRKLILIATGSGKAEIIRRTLSSPITTRNPATLLQLHPDVTFILDQEAASLLENKQPEIV